MTETTSEYPILADSALAEFNASLYSDYFYDGSYGREMGRVSPEGNIYGQTRRVREISRHVWWDGEQWRTLEIAGQVDTLSDLPQGPRATSEVWRLYLGINELGEDAFDYYFWNDDLGGWQRLSWFWAVESMDELPHPGVTVGEAHRVAEQDVLVMWDGYVWRRAIKHSDLEDNEPGRHLPSGFIEFLVPDVKLVRWSKRILSLEAVDGGLGYVNINGELIHADSDRSCFYNTPALDLVNGQFQTAAVQPDREYWVYLANRNAAFNIAAYDYRARLFLSATPPVNGCIGTGIGVNTIVAGTISMDDDPDGPFFRHEIDISWISRRPNIVESFRDYSDFYLRYIGPDELKLERMEGYYGQIYVPEELLYLGDGQSILRSAYRLEVNSETLAPELDNSPIAARTRYYLYIINDVDAVNFNTVNANTGRPWRREDENSANIYISELDLRRRAVLCSRPHEHYRLTETYPLFYSRCIGHIDTDANGRFVYSKDMSYIKGLVVNPVHLRGLADFIIQPDTADQFIIAMKPATEGIIYVGGQDVRTYPANSASAHRPATSDTIWEYTGDTETPLTATQYTVIDRPAVQLWVYIANYDDCWGALKGRHFWVEQPPVAGYLAADYPGTGARWVATVQTNEQGKFVGYWLMDSPGDQTAALLNLNAIAKELSNQTDQLSDHVGQIDYLMGWGSALTSDLDSYVSGLWSNYSGLSENVDDLWGNYSAISGIAGSLDSTVDSLYGELSEISADVRQLDSHISNISGITSNFGIELSGVSNTLSSMGGNLTSLDVAVTNMGSDISSLYVFKESFTSETWSLLSNTDYLLSLTDSLKSAMSDIQSDMSELSDLTSQIDSLDSRLQSGYSYISNVYSLMSANFESRIFEDHQQLLNLHLLMEINHSALSNDYQTLSGIQTSMSTNVNTLFANVSTLSATTSNLWENASSISAQIAALSGLHSSLSLDVSGLGFYLGNLSTNLGLLTSNINSLSSGTSLSFGNVNSNINSISDDVSWLFTYYSQISGKTNSLSNITSTLDGNINSLYGNLSILSGTVNTISGNIQTQSALTSSLSAALNTLSTNLNTQSSYIVSLSNITSDLGVGIQLHSAYLSSLSQGLGNLSNTASLINAAVTNLSNTTSDLGGKYSATSTLVNSISGTVSLVSQNANNLSGLTQSLSTNLNNLSSNYAATSGAVSALTINYTDLNSRFATISGYYNSYSLEVNWLESTMNSLSVNLSQTSTLVNTISTLTYSLSNQAVSMSNTLVTTRNNLNALSGNVTGLSNYVNTLSNQLISGYVGTVPRLITYDWIGLRFKFEDQKSAGLPVRIDYLNTTTVRIVATEPEGQIVFPDGGLYNFAYGAYFNLNIGALAANNLYILYLKSPGAGQVRSLNGAGNQYYWHNYTASGGSTKKYGALGTRSTTGSATHDSVAIAYCVPVTHGVMAGSWNIWSIYRQAQWLFSAPMTTAAQITITKQNLIRPSIYTSIVQYRTGYSSSRVCTTNCWANDKCCTTPDISLGMAACQAQCINPIYVPGGLAAYPWFANTLCYAKLADELADTVAAPFGNMNLSINHLANYSATGYYYIRVVPPSDPVIL